MNAVRKVTDVVEFRDHFIELMRPASVLSPDSNRNHVMLTNCGFVAWKMESRVHLIDIGL